MFVFYMLFFFILFYTNNIIEIESNLKIYYFTEYLNEITYNNKQNIFKI